MRSRLLIFSIFIIFIMSMNVHASEEDEGSEYVTVEEGSGNTVKIGDRLIPLDARMVDLSGISLNKCNLKPVFSRMKNLKKVTMIDCGYTNEEYAGLQDAFPGVRFIWEIQFSRRKLRTDAVGFSTFRGGDLDQPLKESDAYYLKYCRDMIGIDLGHNPIHDLSFLQYMHELKMLILVDNSLTDIDMVRYAREVKYLEIFVNSIPDISPIEPLKDLEDLNFSRNPVKNIDAVKNLPKLRRLVFMETRASAEDIKEVRKLYPNTKVTTTGINSLAGGWREDSHYYAMRRLLKNNEENEIFHATPGDDPMEGLSEQ